MDASRESVRLFSTLPPSHWHVSTLGAYGRLLDVVGRPDEAAEVLARALSVARASGSPDNEAAVLTDLAGHEFFAGDWHSGQAHLARAADLTRESQDVEALLLVATAETDVLLRMGQLDQTVLVAEQALERIRSLGGGSFPDASIVAANLAEALLEPGRVTDAALVIDPLTSGQPTLHDRSVHQLRVRLDMVRGHLDEATDRLDAVRTVVPGNPSILLEIEQDALDIALWRRRPEDAFAGAMTFLTRIADTPDSRGAGRLLTSAMRASGDLAARARARGDQQALRHAIEGGEQLVALHTIMRDDPFAAHPALATAEAEHATWRAERARLTDADHADSWEVAADAWTTAQRPHRRAYALWRQAEAFLAAGDSSRAATVLRVAASLATDMAPLLERIVAVARRARVDLGPFQPPIVASNDLGYSLTERELDVLRLLARGHTNAQIGADLFMSPKTASVHVTHILRKLGVTGRVQAATVAERAGLLDDSG